MAEAKPKHGRRAEGEEKPATTQGWGDEGGAMLTAEPTMGANPDSRDPVDLPTLDAGVDETLANQRPEVEDMSKEVASAPTEYHAAMPKLADLEASAGSKYAHIQHALGDVDISCLTSVLCTQLDEADVPWFPDQMLVQLTSELADQNKAEKENEEKDAVSTAL